MDTLKKLETMETKLNKIEKKIQKTEIDLKYLQTEKEMITHFWDKCDKEIYGKIKLIIKQDNDKYIIVNATDFGWRIYNIYKIKVFEDFDEKLRVHGLGASEESIRHYFRKTMRNIRLQEALDLSNRLWVRKKKYSIW